MTMSLGQAAIAAKRAKGTIHKAIRSGKMTAPKDENGHYMIDPAELHRVFPLPVSKTSAEPYKKPEVNDGDASATKVLQAELNAERWKIERLEDEIAELKEQRVDLKGQRDKWQGQAEAQTRAIADLTKAQEAGDPAKSRGLWARVLGKS